MIELIYENNRGQKINLTKLPYWLNVEPVMDYEWDYTKREKRRGTIIAGFTKNISSKDLILHIMSHSKSVVSNAVDEFNSVIESDIYDGTPGKIWCGDWYTYGYIIGSKNEKWQYDEPVMKKKITFVREQESWFRQTIKKSYEGDSVTPQVESWVKRYDTGYDFAHDYMVDFESSVTLTNPDALPSVFILSIQGPALQPEIRIGDNVIGFNYDVPDGAVLEVNAVTKKTTTHLPDGTDLNVFGARDPDYYIFERIPSGRSAVTWDGSFNWEITLIEERSEPRWLTV